MDDERFRRLLRNEEKIITITNSETLECFYREITDVTIWDGYMIISWKHGTPYHSKEKLQ